MRRSELPWFDRNINRIGVVACAIAVVIGIAFIVRDLTLPPCVEKHCWRCVRPMFVGRTTMMLPSQCCVCDRREAVDGGSDE